MWLENSRVLRRTACTRIDSPAIAKLSPWPTSRTNSIPAASRGLSHSAAIKGPEKSTTNCSPRAPSGRKCASGGRGLPHACIFNLLRIGPDSQSYGFPVVMYRRESGTIKKDECQRIDAFELWCWRRLLRVPWTVRRSNQSILKEINPEYSLKGWMLKLKL